MAKYWLSGFFLIFVIALFGMEVPVSSEPVMTEANHLTGMVRVDPDDKQPEKLRTDCYLWQDGDYLVARFVCEIDAKFRTGTPSPRDSAGDSDYVRLQLITIPDAYYAYYFAAYPNGSLMDGVRNSNLNVDFKWNSHYTYETFHNDREWVVTLRIPLSELRFEQKLPYRWKVILTRYHEASEEFYSFPYANTNQKLEYFRSSYEISLSRKVHRKTDIKFMPYFVKSYDLLEETDSFDPDNLGLDFAFNPGQRTRIKIAINPDYSDVPPDNASDNYNSKYPPFLAEGRFFFTEDIDAFGVDMDIFYSRNIAKPRLAYKATGNLKAWNWGILGAFDRKMTIGDEVVNPNDYYQIVSIIPTWRKLRLTNAVISRLNKDYYNHVAQNTIKLEFLRNLYLKTSVSASIRRDERVSYPETLKGIWTVGSLVYNPKNWYITYYNSYISENFRADAAYYTVPDRIKNGASISFDSDSKERFIKNYGISSNGEFWTTHLSSTKDNESNIDLNLYCYTSPKINFNAYFAVSKETDDLHATHRTSNFTGSITLSRWDEFGTGLNYGYGEQLVYSLNRTHKRSNFSFNVWSTPFKELYANFSGGLIRWDYPMENTIIVDGSPQTVYLDNEYWVANGMMQLTPGKDLRLRAGASLDTYYSAGVKAQLRYYASLRYEFRPEYFLYMGVTNREMTVEDSEEELRRDQTVKTSSTAYMKLSITL